MIWLWRKDSNLRMAALTVRCLTSLATPQKNDEGEKGKMMKRAAVGDKVTNMRITSFPVARFSFPSLSLDRHLVAGAGVEPAERGL